MSQTIHVDRNERGAIRVFAINKPPQEIADALTTTPKPDLARQLLNSPHLNTASTEIFPVSDLTGLGLSAYLSEGYAVTEDELNADRARLDALEGYVLLLFSDSFKDTDTTLSPGTALTLIGTYSEFIPAASSTAIDAESAQPYTGAPGMAPPTPARGPAGSAMVVLAIAVLSGLALWWLLT